MIEDHLDPTAEAHTHITNLLRTAITAAAAIADKAAQRRQQQQQETARRSDAERRALSDRLAAERTAAELVYRRTYQDSWWQRAQPIDIAVAVEAAGGWAGSDPKAADAFDHISEQLQARYGLNLPALYATAGTPAAAAAEVHTAIATPHQADLATAGEPPPWHTEVLTAAGADLGRPILDSPGWPNLARQLTTLRDRGHNVAGRLSSTLRARELDSAKDKAQTLAWRLRTDERGPAGDGKAAALAASPAAGSPPLGSALPAGPAPGQLSSSALRTPPTSGAGGLGRVTDQRSGSAEPREDRCCAHELMGGLDRAVRQV